MIIMLSHGFFRVQNEIQQGIWWSVLLYAVVFDIGEKDYSPVRLAVISLGLCLLLYFGRGEWLKMGWRCRKNTFRSLRRVIG